MVPSIRLRDALFFVTATSAFVITRTVSEITTTVDKVTATQIDNRDISSAPKFIAAHVGKGGGPAPKLDDVTTVGLTTVTVFGSGPASNSVGIFEIDSTASAVPAVATSASVSEITLSTANATGAVPSNFTTYTTATNTSIALSWTTETPTGTGGAESTAGVPEPTESGTKKAGAAELSSPFERFVCIHHVIIIPPSES